MRYFQFLILLFLPLTLVSQEVKHWEDGLLEWSDFQEKEISIYKPAHLSYRLEYKAENSKENGTLLIRYKAIAYMKKESSYINEDQKNWQQLKYYQIIFNLIEVERRALQEHIYLTRTRYVYQTVQDHRDKLAKTLKEIEEETEQGSNLSALYLWDKKTNQLLKQYPNSNPLTEFRRRNFGYGFTVGLGFSFYTGSIRDYFQPRELYNFGLNLSYKDITLFTIAALGKNKVIQNYQEWEDWQYGDFAFIDLSIGYPFINGQKNKLTPFIGVGFSEISRIDQQEEENTLQMTNLNWLLGLQYDYKLKKTMDVLGPNEYREMLLRMRFQLVKTDFAPDLQGYTIHFTIGFGNFGSWVKLLDKKDSP